MEVVILALLTSSAFYLGSRATITRALWSRYPRWLAGFMDCAACSGFWYGLGFAWLLRSSLPNLFGSATTGIHESLMVFLTGLCSIVWTPIVAGYMQAGFERLGSAVGEVEDDG